MRNIECLDCDNKFSGETQKEVLDQMHPHYMQDHQDVMKDGDEAKKKVWFDEFQKRWDDGEES